MNLLEFKTFIDAKKRGDMRIPSTNEELKPLLQESLEYIAKACNPIDLRTNDFSLETLRFITANLQIRKPIATIVDDEKIDIDEQLVYAVAYDLLANKSNDSKNIAIFLNKRDEEVQFYVWNNFTLLKELEKDEDNR